mmetsp:Transcript_11924/g.41830  ORF Transcript_11924/g.41830 Transcript_11924/m.41830 type:complete len:310 (-) Transcript_11924:505-1434(-)
MRAHKCTRAREWRTAMTSAVSARTRRARSPSEPMRRHIHPCCCLTCSWYASAAWKVVVRTEIRSPSTTIVAAGSRALRKATVRLAASHVRCCAPGAACVGRVCLTLRGLRHPTNRHLLATMQHFSSTGSVSHEGSRCWGACCCLLCWRASRLLTAACAKSHTSSSAPLLASRTRPRSGSVATKATAATPTARIVVAATLAVPWPTSCHAPADRRGGPMISSLRWLRMVTTLQRRLFASSSARSPHRHPCASATRRPSLRSPSMRRRTGPFSVCCRCLTSSSCADCATGTLVTTRSARPTTRRPPRSSPL